MQTSDAHVVAASTVGGDGGDGGGGEIHGRTSDGSGHASEATVSEYESDAMVKRVPLGAPLPPWSGLPHTWMAPWSSSAANALHVEKIAVKPVPLGAPLPPESGSPHAWMAPWSSSTANAEFVEKIAVKPVPLGAPLPP